MSDNQEKQRLANQEIAAQCYLRRLQERFPKASAYEATLLHPTKGRVTLKVSSADQILAQLRDGLSIPPGEWSPV